MRGSFFAVCILALSLFSDIKSHAQDLTMEWGGAQNGEGFQIPGSSAIDSLGNIYLFGSFEDDVDFDPSDEEYLLNSNGSHDLYLLKLSSDGQLIWGFSLGSNSTERAFSLALDNGSLYVTGTIEEGEIDFDPSESSALIPEPGGTYSRIGFLAKYDTNGNFIWVDRVGLNTRPYASNVDDMGNVLLTGQYSGEPDFNPSANDSLFLPEAAFQDFFISKYNPNGDLIWVDTFGSFESDVGFSIGLDQESNIYVTGFYEEVVYNLDSTVLLPSNGRRNMFLAKYGTDGDMFWINGLSEGLGNSQGNSLAINSENEICLTGQFTGFRDFDFSDESNILDGNDNSTFVAKYSSLGELIWVNVVQGQAWNNSGYDIGIDESDNLYVTGFFRGEAYFDFPDSQSKLVSNGNSDVFLVKYTADGLYEWFYGIGGAENEHGQTISVDGEDSFFLAGEFREGSVDFDPSINELILTSVDDYHYDTFYGKYSFSCEGLLSVICQDDTVFINEDGIASLQSQNILDESSINCATATFNLSQNSFGCGDIGENGVTLTAYDNFGHESSCSANISVQDLNPPTISCNDTVMTLIGGELNLNFESICEVSYDNCSINSYSLSQDYFTCEDSGENIVILNVEDSSGNSSTCTSTVSIEGFLENEIEETFCSSYASPSGDYIWTSSGTYFDTIPNSNGCDSLLTIHLTLRDTLFANDQFLEGDVFTTSIGESGNDGYQDEPYNSIQQAIEEACPKGVIKIDAGTYNEQIVVTSDSLTLIGAGVDKTFIHLDGIESDGLSLIGNGITLKNLTTIGDSLSNLAFSALKIGSDSTSTSGVKIENVRIENSGGNGIEVLLAQNTMLIDIESNSHIESGITIMNSMGTELENISTSDNGLTGVHFINSDDLEGSIENTVITGENSIAESNSDNGGMLLEMTGNKPLSWGIDSEAERDLIFSPVDFGFALDGENSMQVEPDSLKFIRLFEELEQAQQAAAGTPIYLSTEDRFIHDAFDSELSPETEFYVFDDPESKMSIQAAINASVDENTINVFEGNFSEQIEVSKNIHILGQGEVKPIVAAFDNMPTAIQGGYTPLIYVNNCDSVSISNIELDGQQTGNSNEKLTGIFISNSTGLFDNLNINNIQSIDEGSAFEGAGIFCFTSAENLRITIQNSEFSNCENKSIISLGGVSNFVIQNNSIEGFAENAGETEDGISLNSAQNVSLINNVIFDYSYSTGSSISHAVKVVNTDSVHCAFNTFTNCGIGLSSKSRELNFQHNVLTDLQTGLSVDDFQGELNLLCSNNDFSQLGTVIVSSTDDVSTSLGVFQNSFTDYSELLSSGLSNQDLALSCNWFGTTNANDIEASLGGAYNYEPFLTNGLDASEDFGFQIQEGSCNGIAGGCTDPEADNYDPGASIDNGTCEYCAADLDDDGEIGTSDLLLFLSGLGCDVEPCSSDINFDGLNNSNDLLILLGQFGTNCNLE